MKNVFRIFAILFLLVVSAYAARPTKPGPHGRGETIFTDGVLVQFTNPIHSRDFRVLHPGRGRFKDVFEVAVEPPFTPEGFVQRLRETDSRVKHTEVSRQSKLRGVPNDPYFRLQWYLGAPQVPAAPSIGFVELPEQGVDYSKVLVYVGDAGCPVHVDLADDLIPKELRQKFVDDGFPNDDTKDRNGHPTAVFGAMAATSNNGVGLASMGSRFKYGCGQVLGPDGTGDMLDLISLLEFITELQIKRLAEDPESRLLLVLPLGGYGYSDLFEVAKNRCTSTGVIIVAAAGNDGLDLRKDRYDWLCSGSNPNIVVVAASDLKDQPAVFSKTESTNYGLSVDVFAPGYAIPTLGLNNTYLFSDGTSMAAPIAAQAVMMMLVKFPGITPKAIKLRLMNGDPIVGRHVGDTYVSPMEYSRAGVRLNVEKALSENWVAPAEPTVIASVVQSTSVKTELAAIGPVLNCETLFSEQQFETGDEPGVRVFGELLPNFSNGVAVVAALLEEGKVYYRRARCYNRAGQASPMTPLERVETQPLVE